MATVTIVMVRLDSGLATVGRGMARMDIRGGRRREKDVQIARMVKGMA